MSDPQIQQALLRIEKAVDANTALLRGGSNVEDRGVLGKLDEASRRCEKSADSIATSVDRVEGTVSRIEVSIQTISSLADDALQAAHEALAAAQELGADVSKVEKRVEALEAQVAGHRAEHGLVDELPPNHLVATERALAWWYRWRIGKLAVVAAGSLLLYTWKVGWISISTLMRAL